MQTLDFKLLIDFHDIHFCTSKAISSFKEMFYFILLTIFPLNVEAYIDKDILFKKWTGSQVLLYRWELGKTDLITKLKKAQSVQNIPICFGNLLTSKHGLTVATCFMDMEKINELIEKNPQIQIQKKYLNGDFLKSIIKNYIFVQVHTIHIKAKVLMV